MCTEKGRNITPKLQMTAGYIINIYYLQYYSGYFDQQRRHDRKLWGKTLSRIQRDSPKEQKQKNDIKFNICTVLTKASAQLSIVEIISLEALF